MPKPTRRVLELGCESGVLTLALASLCPDSEFVGVDQQEQAVDVARELANLLEVGRVIFLVAALADLDPAALGSFDLVLAVSVFDDLLEGAGAVHAPPGSDGFSIEDPPLGAPLRRNATRTTRGAGLRTDFIRSEVLQVGGRNWEVELLPVTVHPHGTDQSDADLIDGILGVFSAPGMGRQNRQLEFEGPAAEATRWTLVAAERVLGFDLDYLNGSGTERVEVLLAGPLALPYHATTQGMRKLELAPMKRLHDFWERAMDYRDRSNSGWRIVPCLRSGP